MDSTTALIAIIGLPAMGLMAAFAIITPEIYAASVLTVFLVPLFTQKALEPDSFLNSLLPKKSKVEKHAASMENKDDVTPNDPNYIRQILGAAIGLIPLIMGLMISILIFVLEEII